MSKTDDIHRAILARAAQPAAPRVPPAAGAKPYVAEAGQRLAEGLREENLRLKAERANGMLVLTLDPKRVRATEFINRDERAFLENDPKFVELKESLRTYGQEQPIRVRPVSNDPSADFEIVSGHRRHRASLALDAEIEGGFPLYALLDAKASESRDLVLKMYRENEERADLSAFEKGRMFALWLQAGLYESQRDLAAGISLGEATVTKYLALAALPAPVLAAFGDERAISLRWTPALSQALKANEAAVLRTAERLAKRNPLAAPDVVQRALVAAAANRPAATHGTSREESVRIGGRVPLKVGSGRNRIVLKLQHVDDAIQKQMREELKDWAEAWLRKRLDGS